MSLYAVWITHLAGWAAETPVEHEEEAVSSQDAADHTEASAEDVGLGGAGL